MTSLPAYSETPDAPSYSASPALTELVLDSAPSVDRRSCASTHIGISSESSFSSTPTLGDYVYRSKHLVLNLGPRVHGTSAPCFGLGAVVTGYVEMERFDYVTDITVALQGFVETTLARDNVSTQSLSARPLKVLHLEKSIWTLARNGNATTNQSRLTFSFSLPTCVSLPEGEKPLPPTFKASLPSKHGGKGAGLNASVRYSVKVEIIRRKLFRSNISLSTPFIYAPRSTPPSPLLGAGFEVDAVEWHVVYLPSSPNCTFRLALPKPLTYAARQPISWMITLESPSPITPSLSVELVKLLVVTVMSRKQEGELVLGRAVVRTDMSERKEDGSFERVVKGDVKGGNEFGEMSWKHENLVEVQYALRIVIKTQNSTHTHYEKVNLTTHPWDPTADVSFPALGLARSNPG